MESVWGNIWLLLLTVLLVLVNGFFVAAEFALVKVRAGKIEAFVSERRPFAKLVRAQLKRLDAALSACQLGITLASLGLGWVGEPALARLLRPAFHALHIQSEVLQHTLAFAIAFSVITSLHLVIGEQVPKMYAVRNPERVSLWCALPLRVFYIIAYPFLIALNVISNRLLAMLGIGHVGEHDSPHSEDEIRALLAQSHMQGELTKTEHRLLNAVFDFDDRVAREVMVPRREVISIEKGSSLEECLFTVKQTQHTRYPYVDGSLDEVLGVIHIKDLLGADRNSGFEVESIVRPPQKVTQNTPIGRLLRQFQASKQHMAFVYDEFGTVLGVVTLENVLEQIVGSVQDEFDAEEPRIKPGGKDSYLVDGSAHLSDIRRQLQVDVEAQDAETISGAVTESLGRLPEKGDIVELGMVRAEVLSVLDDRVDKLKLTLVDPEKR